MLVEPSECVFNNPTLWEHHETFLVVGTQDGYFSRRFLRVFQQRLLPRLHRTIGLFKQDGFVRA